MISLEDARWSNMTGGYKMPFDPRLLIERLETDTDTTDVWQELWNELHHQGDVGEASYAAVPFLVESYRKRRGLEWNTYAIVAIIELAREEDDNPEIPQWIAGDFFQAIRSLAEVGISELMQAKDTDNIRAILSVIAISKGLRAHGKFLVNYSEDELIEIESKT